jgi:hypothetical protein
VIRSRLAIFGLLALALWGGLFACDSGPTPSGPPATSTVAGPPPTPSSTPVPQPSPTPSNTATPAATMPPTPTEGPVRTPVSGAAAAEFTTALAAMDAAPSYRYTLQLQLGAPEARYVLTGTGAYAPPAAYDTNFNALGFNSEIRVISDTTYVRSYGVWHKGPPDALLYPMGPPPSIPDIVGLPSYAVEATPVGTGDDTLDGGPARHYRFVLRANSLIGPGNGLGTSGGELWVDPTTHRFRRLVLIFGQPGATGDNDGTLQLDFSNYGTPVTLTAPPLPTPP